METYRSGTTFRQRLGSSLPFEARFVVAGGVWLIESNAAAILTAARETFQPVADETSPIALTISCYVDSEISAAPPWPASHFRGLDQFVYAAHGSGGSLVMDLRRRRVIGLFSPAMARDSSYWKRVLLPVLLGATSASIGLTPLHCACVVKNGRGLVLAGPSGVGKSTLAVFLCLRKFAYLSDGWTFFSRSGSGVQAWSLPTPVKLLPDAVEFFPELGNASPGRALNGEFAYEVDPAAMFGVDRSECCEPHWLVFVERTDRSAALFRTISSDEAFSRFATELESLPACISDMREVQLQTINTLVDRECWLFRHALSPMAAAKELSEFCGVYESQGSHRTVGGEPN